MKERPAPGVFLAEKKDVTQTFFTIGHLGGMLRDKDFAALEMMAGILGGGFAEPHVRPLRTKLGMANDVTAAWGAGFDHPGLFEISGSTKCVSTAHHPGDQGGDRAHAHRRSDRRGVGTRARPRSTAWSLLTTAGPNVRCAT